MQSDASSGRERLASRGAGLVEAQVARCVQNAGSEVAAQEEAGAGAL